MNTLQRCLPRTVSLLDGRHAAAVVFRYCSSSSSGGGGGGGDSKGGPVVILEKRKNEELKSAVGHSPNTNGNDAASKDGLREELQLLDTEFKLAFTFVDKNLNNRVHASALRKSLIDFGLATNVGELEHFITRVAAETDARNGGAAPPKLPPDRAAGAAAEDAESAAASAEGGKAMKAVQPSPSSASSSSSSSRLSNKPLHSHPPSTPTLSSGADSDHQPQPHRPLHLANPATSQPESKPPHHSPPVDRRKVTFDAFVHLLDADQIQSLQPASLVLDTESAGAIMQVRNKNRRWTSIPLTDHMQMIWRRFQHELTHYMRGFKLFKEQLGTAWMLIRSDVQKIWAQGTDAPRSDLRLVKLAFIDMLKLIPFLVVSCLPGGSVVVVAMSRLLPASLPSTFQNAPRWEKYSQVDNMVRDVSSTLSEGIGYARVHDHEWREFLEASNTAWEQNAQSTAGQDLQPHGPDLGRVLDKLTNLQPVSAFDRITSTQVNTAFAALDLTMPDGVVGQAFSKSPYLTDWYQYRMLRRRISKLRSSDIDLAESPEGIKGLSKEELHDACKARGLYVTKEGENPRIHGRLLSKEYLAERSTPAYLGLTQEQLMRSWLTRWIAHSSLKGYDSCFLALWSLELGQFPESLAEGASAGWREESSVNPTPSTSTSTEPRNYFVLPKLPNMPKMLNVPKIPEMPAFPKMPKMLQFDYAANKAKIDEAKRTAYSLLPAKARDYLEQQQQKKK